MSKKMQERRLQWFGHVERREEDYIGKRVRNLEVSGSRAVGRPKKTWRNCVIEDMRENVSSRGTRPSDLEETD
ncbi:hypothetical protein M8J77_001554 [Diaphorina citri]|nr:hypothetical protein M8J77_001554 [Diaphorina citri]